MKNSRRSLGKFVGRGVDGLVEKLAGKGSAEKPAKRTAIRALILTCLLLPLAAAAAGSALPAALDLRSEAAEAARHGQPLLILFSRPDCPYCDEVRETWLHPLSRDPKQGRLGLRQVNQDSEQALVDFAGRSTTHAAFAVAEKVKLVPVVAVYGPRGQRLAEPIVGTRLPDFYGSYLSNMLEEARMRLRRQLPDR